MRAIARDHLVERVVRLLLAVLVGDEAAHAVVEWHPLGVLRDVLPDALELGVEEVRAVLRAANPVVVEVVVAVAPDVVSHVDD